MCTETAGVEIDGIWVEVDACIASLVAALNRFGIATLSSCCGHGQRPGRVVLRSGVELEIHPYNKERAYTRWSDLVSAREIEQIGRG